MKIKVVSYFVDAGNQKYLKLSKLCEEMDRKYCDLYGYDIQFDYYEPQKLIDYYGKCGGKEMVSWRIPYILEKLNKDDCDYLVVLDSDCTISKPTIKFEDLIDDTHEFFLSRGNEKILQINCFVNIANKLNQIFQREKTERYLTTHYYDTTIMRQYDMFKDFDRLSYGYILNNEGFVIIKNTLTMKKFFEECVYLQKNYFMDTDPDSGIIPDGRSFMFLLCQRRYKDLYTFMPDIAQGGIANSYETHYDVQKTFILHNYGLALNLDQKIEWIQSLKNNKWWVRYFK